MGEILALQQLMQDMMPPPAVSRKNRRSGWTAASVFVTQQGVDLQPSPTPTSTSTSTHTTSMRPQVRDASVTATKNSGDSDDTDGAQALRRAGLGVWSVYRMRTNGEAPLLRRRLSETVVLALLTQVRFPFCTCVPVPMPSFSHDSTPGVYRLGCGVTCVFSVVMCCPVAVGLCGQMCRAKRQTEWDEDDALVSECERFAAEVARQPPHRRRVMLIEEAQARMARVYLSSTSLREHMFSFFEQVYGHAWLSNAMVFRCVQIVSGGGAPCLSPFSHSDVSAAVC